MGQLALEGMYFNSNHGFYDLEQTLGNDFIVDVYLSSPLLSIAGNIDSLSNTINYEHIYVICRHEMSKPARLLETVAISILESLEHKIQASHIKVRVSKIQPPIGKFIGSSYVEVETGNPFGKIGLKDMRFNIQAGATKAEKLVVSDYSIDLTIDTLLTTAAKTDDLYDTINYEQMYIICRYELSQPFNIIEALAVRINNKLKQSFNSLYGVSLSIQKIKPTVGKIVDKVALNTTNEYLQLCRRCKTPLICYKDKNCWCHNVKVLEATQAFVKRQYKGCLCNNCLTIYAG